MLRPAGTHPIPVGTQETVEGVAQISHLLVPGGTGAMTLSWSTGEVTLSSHSPLSLLDVVSWSASQPMALLVVRGWNLESAFKRESQRFPVELCRHVLAKCQRRRGWMGQPRASAPGGRPWKSKAQLVTPTCSC